MKQAPVELSAYDPEWPAKFEVEKNFLMQIIGAWFFGSIEHVGSTSVPGLIAKPVIDIMFGVKSLEKSRDAIAVLIGNGYVYFPYKDDVMHWFCKPSAAFRTHHLHLIPYKSLLWNERIQFRDLLRCDRNIASAYANLKIKLAALYKEDREAYTREKGPFIQKILYQIRLMSKQS
ncbi:MAG: GrpB family protein [Cyanobacteria bacterium SBLK]|nr:GrpB family protein [Cyanobacteria bacterium SBLK]